MLGKNVVANYAFKRNEVIGMRFLIGILWVLFPLVSSAQRVEGRDTFYTKTCILSNDTLPFIELPTVEVRADTMSTSQYYAYLRMQYNVRKVYGYALLAAEKLRQCEAMADSLTRPQRRRKAMRNFEKELKEEYGETMKSLTVNQGKILFKLIDRETGVSVYELIKDNRGGLTAFGYQTMAVFFGHNLKKRYDPNGEDRQIEEVVWMIKTGRLSPFPISLNQATKNKKNAR